MNVNPIGNSPPGKKSQGATPPADGKFQEELRVKKTDEVDADGRKKRKERALNQADDAPLQTKHTPLRSIYDANFSKGASFGRPAPSKVPPSAPVLSDNERLPHSQDFWKRQANNPKKTPQESAAKTRTQTREEPRSSKDLSEGEKSPKQTSEDKKGAKASQDSFGKEETASFVVDAPFSSAPKDEDNAAYEKDAKVVSSSEGALFSVEDSKETDTKDEKNDAQEEGKDPSSFTEENLEAASTTQTDVSKKKSSLEEKSSPKTHKKRGKRLEALAASFAKIHPMDTSSYEKEGETQAIASPSPSISISPSAVETASSVSRATLPPSVDNLFTQMVGTVLVMTTKGIAKTEVVLDSPAFIGSRFYGSALVFEKYATAPDSFNIQLIGKTSQQVNDFAAAVSGLQEAFLEGKFSFRIGRLDSYYDPDRALFHRKDPTERQEEGSDSGKEKR